MMNPETRYILLTFLFVLIWGGGGLALRHVYELSKRPRRERRR